MSDINKPILAFVIVILGVIFVTVIAGEILTKTAQTGVSSESLNIAPARLAGGAINTTYEFYVVNRPTGWKIDDPSCDISGFQYRNSSGTTLTVTTDYIFNVNYGNFTIKNTVGVNGTTSNSSSLSYAYCADGFLSQPFARSSLNMVPGFIVLLILIGIIASVYLLVRQIRD